MTTQLDFVTGDWVVRIEQLHLEHRHSGQVTPLEPRLAALLTSLVSRKGALVTKEMLLEEVWQGAVVSDDSIAQAVSRLRKILGDDPKSPRYVQTVWKKGYRWLSQIESQSLVAKPASTQQPIYIAMALMVCVALVFAMTRHSQTPQMQQYETRTLTSLPGMEGKGVLSSDGRNVAFQSTGGDIQGSIIRLSDIHGGASKALDCKDRCFAPVFSEDGNRLAFISYEQQRCDIVLSGLVTGIQSIVADCSGSIYPDLDWHEGQDTFVLGLRQAAGKPVAIYAIEQNQQKTQLTFPPKGAWGDFDPAISPDGKKVVFTRAYTEMQHDLFVVENAQERRLTQTRAAIMGSTWSPDGKSLVFATRQRVGYRLYRLELDSLEVRQLNIAATEVIEPFVAANGDLVATVRDFDTDLYRVNLTDGSDKTLFDSTHWDLSPAISPDGRQFVFTSDRNGLFQLWLGEVDSGVTRPLTRFDGNYVVAPKFSPDGKRLVFEVHDGEFSQIYTYDLASSMLLRLTQRQSINVVPSISSNGAYVYFASNQSGAWQVWRKPLDGGEAVQVTEHGGYTAFESPDGQWLYYNKRNEPGIWRMDLTTQTEVLLTDKLAADDVGAFYLTAGGLVYLNRQQGRFGVIEHLDWQGNIKVLYALDRPTPRFDPVLSATEDLSQLYLVGSSSLHGDLIRIKGLFK